MPSERAPRSARGARQASSSQSGPGPGGRPLLGWVLVAALGAGLGFGVALGWRARQQQASVGELHRRLVELERRVTRLEQQQQAPGREQLQVYFTRTEAGGGLEVVAVTRSVPRGSTPEERLRRALESLLAGPTAEETRQQRLYSQIPEGTRLLGVRVQGETAFLDFSRELERTGGTLRLSGILHQLVFTATEVPPVKRVVLLVEGERVGTERHPFTGDGLLFGELTRESLPL